MSTQTFKKICNILKVGNDLNIEKHKISILNVTLYGIVSLVKDTNDSANTILPIKVYRFFSSFKHDIPTTQ